MSKGHEFGRVAYADLQKEADGTVSEATLWQALGRSFTPLPKDHPLNQKLRSNGESQNKNGANVIGTTSTTAVTSLPLLTYERSILDIILTDPEFKPFIENEHPQNWEDFAKQKYPGELEAFRAAQAKHSPPKVRRTFSLLRRKTQPIIDTSSDQNEPVRRIAIPEPTTYKAMRVIRRQERRLAKAYVNVLSKIPLPSQDGITTARQKIGELAKKQAHTLFAGAGRIFASTSQGGVITDLLPSLREYTLQNPLEAYTSSKIPTPIDTPTFPTASTMLKHNNVANNHVDLR